MAQVVEKQCMFAQRIDSLVNQGSDLLLVKERLRYDDGTETSNLELIKDYPRKFWVTKKGMQETHKKKKEWE